MYTIDGNRVVELYANFVEDFNGDIQVRPPFWVIIEGDDGVGKTTTAHILRNFLTQIGFPVVLEAEGKHITEVGSNPTPFWYERSVRHHLIGTLLRSGYSVIQDRSWVSTAVYQEQEDAADLANLMYGVLGVAPDAIFLLEGKDGLGRYECLRNFKAVLIPSLNRIIPIVIIPDMPSHHRVHFILTHLFGTKGFLNASNETDGYPQADGFLVESLSE